MNVFAKQNKYIVKHQKNMPLRREKIKMKKYELSSKICVRCHRPFNWRKKWKKVWDDIKYCSERCRRSRGANGS